MKKKIFPVLMLILSVLSMHAQTLEKMNWFNEPDNWQIDGNKLSMYVTPNSDYWRISHYGFTVDDAPFCYATYGGRIRSEGEGNG